MTVLKSTQRIKHKFLIISLVFLTGDEMHEDQLVVYYMLWVILNCGLVIKIMMIIFDIIRSM